VVVVGSSAGWSFHSMSGGKRLFRCLNKQFCTVLRRAHFSGELAGRCPQPLELDDDRPEQEILC
jgi:hypothetical protein